MGAGISLAMGAAGAAVLINYHSDGDAAAELVGGIRADRGRAISVEADVLIE